MRFSSRRLTAVLLACVSAACDSHVLTAPEQVAVFQPPPETLLLSACATIDVRLKYNNLDSVVVSATTNDDCTQTLRVTLGGAAVHDHMRKVVRLPLRIRNDGTDTLEAPTRLYGWADSLIVHTPAYLAGNGAVTGHLVWLSSDSAIGPSAGAFANALVWRFDTLLPLIDASPRLCPGPVRRCAGSRSASSPASSALRPR